MLNPTFFSWVPFIQAESMKAGKEQNRSHQFERVAPHSHGTCPPQPGYRFGTFVFLVIPRSQPWAGVGRVLPHTSHRTFADREKISAKVSPSDTPLRFTRGTRTPFPCTHAGWHSQGAASPRDKDFSLPGPHCSPRLDASTNTVPARVIATTPNRNASPPNVALLHSKPPLSVSRLPGANAIPSPRHKLLGRKSTAGQPDEQSRRFALVAEI